MLATIARRTPDRVPFATYNCHPFTGSPHASDAGYAPVLEAIRATGAGCLCKTSAVRRKRAVEPMVERRREGTSLVRVDTWETPRGTLNSVTRTPDGQPSMCVKRLIVSEEDVERYFSIPYVDPAWDVSGVLARVAEIGDKGIAYLDYADPFNQIAELFDQEEFLVRSITDLPGVERLVERQFERDAADLASLLAALGPRREEVLFYTAGPERATPPLMPPAVFARLIVPFHARMVRMMHDAGCLVSLHCHGRVRDVLDSVEACAFDVLEPIEPPPQGDIDLAELRRRTGGRICLMGYVQDQELHTASDAAIRQKVRAIRAAVDGAPGYICTPTCTPFQHPPSATYVRNYVAFLEEADRIF